MNKLQRLIVKSRWTYLIFTVVIISVAFTAVNLLERFVLKWDTTGPELPVLLFIVGIFYFLITPPGIKPFSIREKLAGGGAVAAFAGVYAYIFMRPNLWLSLSLTAMLMIVYVGLLYYLRWADKHKTKEKA